MNSVLNNNIILSQIRFSKVVIIIRIIQLVMITKIHNYLKNTFTNKKMNVNKVVLIIMVTHKIILIMYVIIPVIIILLIKLYNVLKKIHVQKIIINYNYNVINVLNNVHMMNNINIFMMVLILYNVSKTVI